MGRVELHAERARVMRQTMPMQTVTLDQRTSFHVGEGGKRLTMPLR